MKYFTFTVTIALLFFVDCLGENATAKPSNDDPTINGVTVPAPVTEVDPPNPINPVTTTKLPPTTSSITIPTKPTTSTTTPTTPTNKTTTNTPITTVKPNSTTAVPPTPAPSPSSTMAPVTSTVSPHHDRKFDGPSFVGGIILALGLVAIGFVAFKFYKARTELNYHTL